MAALIQEEAPPVPNWLLKLEEQRAKRLKAKLGHEAGAGAPCQICGTKCPGLDLHFWRKICKICKCGKEDHDISDEDIYGFVQFTLLGSKPQKIKGILLKGSNDEVILEFTPKGSSNDVKKYLDELPADLLPVKGSEAAKLRKQRLQKQMPAHDVDPTLCHALTDEEIKQLEEYVAFIRKHSVGQGSIIRLPLYKGAQHTLNQTNAKLISQTIPNQIASNETVFLQPSDLANNLQNLSIMQHPEKSQLPNYTPNKSHQIIDNQAPIGVEIHPLTTLNVERHQEQYENPNFEITNANLSYNPAYIPSFVNPTEDHQSPTKQGKTTVLNYGPSPQQNDEIPPPINEKTHPNFNDKNSNIGAASRIKPLQPNNLLEPINDRQVPCFGGYIKDLNYPTNSTTNTLKMPVLQAQSLVNPIETHQNLTSVGLLQDLNYPMMHLEDSNSNVAAAKCHECGGVFPEGSVAVSAERTANLWHAKCFNCHTCKQPLADLLYFYHKDTDMIYCGRDYAILKGIPRCAACDELIFVREYCLAEGATFHVKHFCCFECDQPLAGKSYLMENNQPVCLVCFENLKAESCRDCGKVIRPEEQGVCLQDLHWHATDCCFVCKKCRTPLLGQKMLLRNEHLFCSDFCYKNF